MSTIPFRLEYLPNEILIHILQYFDARDLFRAFYNLNTRFNTLLQSLNYLSLTLIKSSPNDVHDYDIFAAYTYSLTIDYAVNIDLNPFLNIHRLVLLSPTSSQLKQVLLYHLPYLEHLSVGYEHFLFSNYIPDLCEKIFSNGFPCLKSCSLFEPRILEIIPHLTPTIQLSILKMDNIDFVTYKALLFLCPNLYLLQFTISNPHDEFCSMKPHLNLKRMIMKFQSLVNLFSDDVMNSYLSCVPNLKQLSVYEINFDVNVKEYLTYNWFAPSIDKHLLVLKRFQYYLCIYGIKKTNDDMISRMTTSFKHVHQNRYQSRLVLNLL